MTGETNNTTEFISKANKIWCFCGIHNLWIENIFDSKFNKYFNKFITFLLILFVAMEIGALFTRNDLTEKQFYDLYLFVPAHCILLCYYFECLYYKKDIKQLLVMLTIVMKSVYNDLEIEKAMIKRATRYSLAFVLSVVSALLSYGLNAFSQVLFSDGSFSAVITAWPDSNDASVLSSFARVLFYLLWWIFMANITIPIVLTIIITIAISHQFKILQQYFYNLNDIFIDESTDSYEKQLKYEQSLKAGIKLHSQTLWCTSQCQLTCGFVFGGQMVLTVYALSFLMLQMIRSEHTLMNVIAIASTSICVLICIGFIMWNAGDITVEAALVPSAIFSSGWHHCTSEKLKRVRPLIILAIAQGQKDVVIRSLNIVVSYQSYLSIVKSSYSAFSLLC